MYDLLKNIGYGCRSPLLNFYCVNLFTFYSYSDLLCSVEMINNVYFKNTCCKIKYLYNSNRECFGQANVKNS